MAKCANKTCSNPAKWCCRECKRWVCENHCAFKNSAGHLATCGKCISLNTKISDNQEAK